MKKTKNGQGATLIELIFFIVVVSLAVVGMIPLVKQVFSHLHRVTEGTQSYFLVQGMVEQIKAQHAAGREEEVRSGACLRPNGTPWVEEGVPLTCWVDVVGATLDATADADTKIWNCKETLDPKDTYRCVTITLHQTDIKEDIAVTKRYFVGR